MFGSVGPVGPAPFAAAAAALPLCEGSAPPGAILAPPVGPGTGLDAEFAAAATEAAIASAAVRGVSGAGRGCEVRAAGVAVEPERSAKRARGPPGYPAEEASREAEIAQRFAGEAAAEMVARRQARGAGRQPTSMIGAPLKPEFVYELLMDKSKPCQGKRPDFINDADIGKIFLEPISGIPPQRKDRRPPRLQQWSQGDMQWFKQVPGVSYGEDGRGEAWVKATYGQVKLEAEKNKKKKNKKSKMKKEKKSQKPADAAAAAAAAGGSSAASATVAASAAPGETERDKSWSYSMYELFWLHNGLEGGAKRANSKIPKFKKADVDKASHWFHGVLYQVKNHNEVEPLGGCDRY